MRRAQLIKYVVTVLFGIVAFVVAAPDARAAAPLCDPRGATMLAPAPQLQETPTSIDIGQNDADCTDLAREKGLLPGQPPIYEIHSPDPGSLATVPPVPPARVSAFLAEPAYDSRPHDGVTSSLERPPRSR